MYRLFPFVSYFPVTNLTLFRRAQNTNTSKVYYVPDKEDDFDEDNPDDDLNF